MKQCSALGHTQQKKMQRSGDYIAVLNTIRGRIQTLNTQLDTYKEKPTESFLTAGVAHTDKAMIEQCQKKTSSMQFVASVNEFSFHWETMTRDQHIKYVHDYVEAEYSNMQVNALEAIKVFLVAELIQKKCGYKHVSWNGYFIERLPELIVQYDDDTGACAVKFKPTVASVGKADKNARSTDFSFGVMRAKLQREKKDFFA